MFQSSEPREGKRRRRWPSTLLMGLLLVALAWPLNWGLSGLRTHWLFFPQWLGYCLAVDGLVRLRKGRSLLSRNPLRYACLFILSVPVWWLFEGLNLFTQNWIYLGRDRFSDLAYFLFSSLSFSTVIPAVFSTAELLGTFKAFARLPRVPRFHAGSRLLWSLHASGWMMLILMITFPEIFFPFMWLSVVFIVDPLNALRGRRSLVRFLAAGNLRPMVVYGLGALVCGFFWELWNLFAYPKWIYSIPYLEFWHVFEMPLAGYGGYIPFGWELFALYHLAAGLTGGRILTPDATVE